MADLNGNRSEDYALLGHNAATGQVTAEVRDSRSAKLVKRVWFDRECIPLDLVSIADINGNGAEELVMLGSCGQDLELRALVKDAKTGASLRRLEF